MSDELEFIWNKEQNAFQVKGENIFVRTMPEQEWEDELEMYETEETDEEPVIVEASRSFCSTFIRTFPGMTPAQAVNCLMDFEREGGEA